jgi:hypothetical protein
MATVAELVGLLPEDERGDGERLITERIVGVALSEAPDQPGFGERVLARVAERLMALPPQGRLHGLRALAGEVEMENLNRIALSLAIARFVHDGHPVQGAAREWLTPAIERLADGPLQDIEVSAATHEELLNRWQLWAQAQQPDVWAGYRTTALQARHAFASARTGSFETSSGGLHDFLTAAQAPTRHMEIF